MRDTASMWRGGGCDSTGMGSSVKPMLDFKRGSHHSPERYLAVPALRGPTPRRGRYSSAAAVIFFPSFKNNSDNPFPVSTAYVSSALLLFEQNTEWKQFPESTANIKTCRSAGLREEISQRLLGSPEYGVAAQIFIKSRLL